MLGWTKTYSKKYKPNWTVAIAIILFSKPILWVFIFMICRSCAAHSQINCRIIITLPWKIMSSLALSCRPSTCLTSSSAPNMCGNTKSKAVHTLCLFLSTLFIVNLLVQVFSSTYKYRSRRAMSVNLKFSWQWFLIRKKQKQKPFFNQMKNYLKLARMIGTKNILMSFSSKKKSNPGHPDSMS